MHYYNVFTYYEMNYNNDVLMNGGIEGEGEACRYVWEG
jgi:hypothetical protein